MSHEVFISFSSLDRAKADHIFNQLNCVYNIPCWICTEDIRAGENFRKVIADAIEATKVLLLVQTVNSVGSREVGIEIDFAFNKEKIIVPFIVEDSELPSDKEMIIGQNHRVDGRKDPLDDRIRELAQELCRILNRPFTEDGNTTQKTVQSELISTPIEFANDDIFIGRESLIQNIRETFDKHRTVCLQGMGGIGKTELAKQYFDRYKKTDNNGLYEKVVFARYNGSVDSLIADDLVFNIKGVSRVLIDKDGREVQQTDEEYAAVKINELKRICGAETLIIIDNFDTDDASETAKICELMNNASFSLLITTRNLLKPFKTIKVKELDNEYLIDLFLQYYYFGNDDAAIEKDDPAFSELFEFVGNHTLTIEIVAKYLKNIRIVDSVSEMISILKDEGFSVVNEDQEQESPYQRIKDVLLKSNLNESEKYFLKCLALMPAAGIRFKDYFGKWLGGNIRVRSSEMKMLEDRGFVNYEASTGVISLHPIILETVVEELKPDYVSCKDFLETFKRCIYDHIAWNYPNEVKNLYYECCNSVRRVLPSKPTAESFDLYYQMANLSSFIDDFAGSKARYDNLGKETVRLFGENSIQFGQILYRSAFIHNTNGYVDAAADMYLKAISLLSECKNETIGEYVLACSEISKIYALKGDTESEKHYLDISVNLINDSSLLEKFEIMRYRKFTVENTVSRKLMREGKYSLALEMAEKALNYCKILPYTMNDVTSILYSIGNICMKIGDYDKAIGSFTESITVGNTYGVFSSLHFVKRLMMTWFVLAECYEAKGEGFADLKAESVNKGLEIAADIYLNDSTEYQEIIEKYGK